MSSEEGVAAELAAAVSGASLAVAAGVVVGVSAL